MRRWFFFLSYIPLTEFFFALFKTIILQFFLQFCKTNYTHLISPGRSKHALPLHNKLYNWSHYETFSWRDFSIMQRVFSQKKCSYVICRVISMGFEWKRDQKNSQNHLYGQPNVFSLLTSTMQIPSPGCLVSKWTLTELSFNMIENLLCLGFISLYLWFCYVYNL